MDADARFPLPYIANTAGWMTAEIGRQPWLVYGLMRTADGYSTHVSAGNGLFTLLGFMGMYACSRISSVPGLPGNRARAGARPDCIAASATCSDA